MLTQDQIDQFHRDGFLAVRGVFSDQEVRALRDAAEAVQADGIAGIGDGHGYREVDGEKQYYRTDGVLWDREAAFRAATVHPDLLTAVGQCMGHPFMPVNNSLVVKMPKSGVAIPWHQDPPYLSPTGWGDGRVGPEPRSETYPVPNFDCDIYLDPATLENGCLYAIAGHHLVGHVDIDRFTQDELFDHPGSAPLEMAPGDILLHALTAPHGSRPNESDGMRRIFYVHFMAREVMSDLYSSWFDDGVDGARGLGPAALDRAQQMLNDRAAAGLASHGDTTAPVTLSPHGFTYPGSPGTPPQHWATLAAALSPDDIRIRKALALGTPS